MSSKEYSLNETIKHRRKKDNPPANWFVELERKALEHEATWYEFLKRYF